MQAKLDDYVSNRDPSQPDYSGNQVPLAPHVTATFGVDYKLPIRPKMEDFQFNANYNHIYFDASSGKHTTQNAYWMEKYASPTLSTKKIGGGPQSIWP